MATELSGMARAAIDAGTNTNGGPNMIGILAIAGAAYLGYAYWKKTWPFKK